MIAWRLTSHAAIARAFSGEGAALGQGRWNHLGTRVVYAADSIALAVLEILVHFHRDAPPLRYFSFRVTVPDDAVEVVPDRDLPRGWKAVPASDGSRSFGSSWIASGRSLALSVPSAIIPSQRCILLNPRHPRFAEVGIDRPRSFRFDQRLLGS